MSEAMERARDSVANLVERFRSHLASYRSSGYHETEVRVEYIDPFFEALGWDVHNHLGYAEPYKDVVHEESMRSAAGIEAPDYTFRIGGMRKFFVEAKKPAVNVKADAGPAYQLRRYAWSGKLPLSILTDFEELAVYDCTRRPAPGDAAGIGRTEFLTCEQYPERWANIWSLFAKDSVLRGSLDNYVRGAKRGTNPVDREILKEIEAWREELARNLALRNPQLSVDELNQAVQLTIDRILFLRVAEDRGSEEYGRLLALLNGANVYPRLTDLYRLADQRYNAGLFNLKADRLTPTLTLDDAVLKDIINGLYYPQSPYEFNMIAGDILGQVYEQFLGKVIRLTAGHRGVVEEKPEVKKAGGVYYTPTYIVDYIVEHTVVELIKGQTPDQISKLRVLDPACGSGSFLLGAYQHLLDYHLEWYTNHDPQQWAAAKKPPLRRVSQDEWRLTTAEKKRILLNNIYGVDIDRQAVEVTKLNLLLKVLEGENDETLGQQLKLWQERALPDLGKNVKCGNSLIGPDQLPRRLFDDQESRRINAFDWTREFPEVMKAGGFDAVIGNPPYIRIQTMKEWAPLEVELYKQHYVAASQGNYDIYVVFVEKGLSLLNPRGCLGFILPSKFFATDYGERLRGLIAKRRALVEVVDFGAGQVFENALTYTCLLFLSAKESQKLRYFRPARPLDVLQNDVPSRVLEADSLTYESWSFASDASNTLAARLLERSISLLQLPCDISRGSSSGADDVFILTSTESDVSGRAVPTEIESELLRVPLHATDFGRYRCTPSHSKWILFPYVASDRRYGLLAEQDLRQGFPLAYAYLAARRNRLLERAQYRAWYGYSAPRNLDVHESAQILVPLLANKGSFCKAPQPGSAYCLMASGGFSIRLDPKCPLSPDYVLGLLNSRLLFWRLRSISNVFQGGWVTCTKQYVGTLPIRTIDFSDPADAARHARMVELVNRMLELHRHLAAARTEADRELYSRQITATDREIDALVYELYGLTEEEIKIVEGE